MVVPNANLAGEQIATNPQGLVARVGPENIVGQLQGLPVILDASLPTTNGTGTNEDVIIVSRLEDNVLFEEPQPRTRVYEERESKFLPVVFSVFGYFAWSSERYSGSNPTIAGSGLAQPSF